MSAVSRLQLELNVWQAAWKQLEAFLDRVEGAADQDAPYANAICALLPVVSVIERARQRAFGVGLGPALPCAPGGVGLAAVTPASLAATAKRIPGVEEIEFAAGTIRVDSDGEVTDDAALAASTTLFAFRDETHGGEVQVRVPTYDFGPLSSSAAIAGVIDSGLFPTDDRRAAAESGTGELKKWSALRQARVEELEPDSTDPAQQPLSAALNALTLASGAAALQAIGAAAAARSSDCKADLQVLENASGVLDEEGLAPDALTAIDAAAAVLSAQVANYDFVATKLSPPAVNSLSAADLETAKARLRSADAPDGAGLLPVAMLALDAAVSPAVDEAVEARLAYPDGSLRMLRTLEWSLRFHWGFRKQWFKLRDARFLSPLLSRVLQVFCKSLEDVLAGRSTHVPLTDVRTSKDAASQVTELSVNPSANLKNIETGQIAGIGGARPTLVVLLGQRTEGKDRRLLISPLNVSIATGTNLPGIPGLVAPDTPIGAANTPVSTQELLRGRAAAGPASDGRVHEVISLGSRLQLILGREGGVGRPKPPALAAPYPTIDAFALLPPLDPTATRLFLSELPSATGSGDDGRLPVARPGELVLVRGADEDGQWWQGVALVDSVDIRTGQAARAEDEITGTTTPPCCGDDTKVMVVTLRSLQLPKTLIRDVTLRRDFLGFGGPSLATGVMLPEELDPQTKTLTVLDNGKTRTVLRDPELRSATAVLKSWVEVDR